jgi:hypothetical protein
VTEECVPIPAYRTDLPTDVDAMVRHLYRPEPHPAPGADTVYGPVDSADQLAFVRVGHTILDSRHSPAVQAAAFRAAERIPGVTARPDTADAAGRRGIAVTRTFRGFRVELVFDATTYAYLGSGIVVVSPVAEFQGLRDLARGDDLHRDAILRVAVADRIRQVP